MLIRHDTTPRAGTPRRPGIRLIEVLARGRVDLQAGLTALGTAGSPAAGGGGAQVAAALLRSGLVDRIAWFHAPAVMGATPGCVQAFASTAERNALSRQRVTPLGRIW